MSPPNGGSAMASFTIKSRLHGDQTFFVADRGDGGYVRHTSPNKPGVLGDQICYGGGYRGNTIHASADELEQVARKWWKQRLAWQRKI